ncbi:hypothetical protein M408DRAFT_30080 [Serendipita vermifera MAFF 305830]|uniref:Uncharacterized protein n=1 Tax=Serendipita vermifera MAFF 305830 TaxID=933852 RepID=A0A0C2W2U9_SERVB|nr:hypothetical protein M408DRAFT_30080 [Serendipita vermifera MAFF 305830]
MPAEISRVERSIAEIMPRIAKLKDAPSPDESHPGNLLDDLGVTSQKEQEALKVARQIDPSVVKASRFGSKENLLLDEDRKYRKAVWVQNNAVDRATSWYTKNIPPMLEMHQQRAEDIKSCIQNMLMREVLSEMSGSCSSSMHAIATFPSTAFISPRHDQVEQEKSNDLLRKADYMNPLDEFRPARPLIGLGPEGLPSVILRVIENFESSPNLSRDLPKHAVSFDAIFELERNCTESDLPALVRNYSRALQCEFLHALFWSDLPLLVITNSDAKQYSDGVPRGRMKSLLNRSIPSNRQEILCMMMELLELFKGIGYDNEFVYASRYLAHRWDSRNIIRSIWRKWDIANDSPLPDGVVRAWGRGSRISHPAKLLWKKTWEPYTPESI